MWMLLLGGEAYPLPLNGGKHTVTLYENMIELGAGIYLRSQGEHLAQHWEVTSTANTLC